jgi:Rhs element Vgr protein
LVITDAGKVSVKAPETSGSAVLTVTYGMDLMEFKGQLNADTQLSAVAANSWDHSTQAIVNNTGATPSLNAQGNITSTTLADVLGVSDFEFQSAADVDADSLKAWSDAQLLKSWMNRITGHAVFQGSEKAKPGVIIEFAGVGDRFNGDAYISGVEHTVENGDWRTRVTVGMEPDWHITKPDVVAPIASGLVPGINGLMIGKVKQLEEDPDNEFRILVKIPTMQDDANGIWARLSTFYATNGAGTFFIPEVDDEVVVGFLNNDPRFPIIIGSLYSSQLPPGKDVDGTDYAMTADNFTKAFLTKGQNKIEFNDDKKIITVTTPGNNKVVLDDDDESITVLDQHENKIYSNTDGIAFTDKNDNKITMNSSGIELNTPKDLKLVATGNISLESTGDTSIKATGNADIKGMQVTATADTAFTAKGSASAEVSASGNLTLKGAMVMIN